MTFFVFILLVYHQEYQSLNIVWYCLPLVARHYLDILPQERSRDIVIIKNSATLQIISYLNISKTYN